MTTGSCGSGRKENPRPACGGMWAGNGPKPPHPQFGWLRRAGLLFFGLPSYHGAQRRNVCAFAAINSGAMSKRGSPCASAQFQQKGIIVCRVEHRRARRTCWGTPRGRLGRGSPRLTPVLDYAANSRLSRMRDTPPLHAIERTKQGSSAASLTQRRVPDIRLIFCNGTRLQRMSKYSIEWPCLKLLTCGACHEE
jgi:hypothetical protein